MNYGSLHSIATVLAFLAFIGVCWWAYRPANRERFEHIGRSALDNDPMLSPGDVRQQQENGK
ncbi:MAG: cbb3-type cytochrome c oxidase subunit 3 [Moraxellaceae bacterium]|jgi:cytochrome c oxidase cbb3-type subunit 4|nr:cbb3-type cytochrome c oxidase subunit 3 [Moraxellaceae bacterium]